MKSLRSEIEKNLDSFLSAEKKKYPEKDTLIIDLHCHDKNSDVPDEKLGRILGVPETWLETEELMGTLKTNGCTAFTITNHNNARSAYELREKGYDVLSAAEFSVTVPDMRTGIHVLTYGFSPDQEKKLNKLRDDFYQFMAYAREKDIPTIWAHPLYHYKTSGMPGLELFEKLAVIFNRFEVMNGQRDTWQNMLIRNYLDGFTEDKIKKLAKKHNVDLKRYSENPFLKGYSGGSDDHMGIFAGLTGTRLYVPDLAKRLKTEPASALALEALKECRMSVFGAHHDYEKMMVAFIDYFCQIGLYMKDPGLLRILLHKGESKQKLLAFLLTNGFAELRRHKMTIKFLETFHNAFAGKSPSFLMTKLVKKDYRPVVKEVAAIAKIREADADERAARYKKSIDTLYGELLKLLAVRTEAKIKKFASEDGSGKLNFGEILESIDLPSHIRSLASSGKGGKVSEMLDGLSFPALAAVVLAGANFASSKVLYNTRPLLEKFSRETGMFMPRKRLLWLTDTFEDNNGVALVLRAMLEEIQRRNLPIDICVCSSKLKTEKNLIVLKPVAEFSLPFYQNQPIRIPNLLQLHELFAKNEYDRVMSSTEGFMGFASIYLKKAFSVPGYFFIHTDWMTFAKKVLSFDKHKLNRMKRLLRIFYGQYEKIFVLNSDQRNWLTSSKMGFASNRVALTAHWVDNTFKPSKPDKKKLFKVSNDEPVILFTGRLSDEKGVDEIPAIYEAVKREIPNLKMVFAGTGPMEDSLKKSMPDALFLGWVNHAELPKIYSSADLLILPSRFDTFGCVVLEALSCGLPVVSYDTKGPREIIKNGECGFTAQNRREMISRISEYFSSAQLRTKLKKGAQKRSADFSRDKIMNSFLADVDLLPEK